MVVEKTGSRWSPGGRLAVAALPALCVLSVTLAFSLRQPWLGLTLTWDPTARAARVLRAQGPAAAIAPGTLLSAVADPSGELRLEGEDFTLEPDANLPSYASYARFLARQGQLADMLHRPGLALIEPSGARHLLTPGPSRPLTSLSADFWVQLIVGLFAFSISAGVWAFRPRAAPARYLLLSGFSTLVFAPLAAVYSTRELALPATEFVWLSDLNFFGGSLYCASLPALLWYYPRRLGAVALGPWLVFSALAWFALQELGAFESMVVGRRTPVFVALIGTLGLSAWQRYATRGDPVARAELSWFLLSWLVGTSLFVALTMVPQLFGVDTSALQGYAFSLFLLVYGGLAFGILRFRLFELGEWWFRIFSWMVGAAMLAAFDLLLAATLPMSAPASLAIALLICGFLWLPVRSWLWTRAMTSSRLDERDLLKRVVGVGLANAARERAERWRELLQELFDPLQMQEATGPGAGDAGRTARLVGEGLGLIIPAVGDLAPLELAYARRGRRLFSLRNAALVTDMIDMLHHIHESREAFQRGARAERSRIARDLHDDIGSRLLSGLHQSRVEQTRDVISQAITEMRTIVHGLTGQRLTVDALIAELRHEIGLRLEAAELVLDWPLSEQPYELSLEYELYKHFLSVMRELVSNVIRHAQARRVRITVQMEGGRLVGVVEDDGVGFDGAPRAEGYGLRNMHKRLDALGGALRYTRLGAGTRVELELPLPAFALEGVEHAK